MKLRQFLRALCVLTNTQSECCYFCNALWCWLTISMTTNIPADILMWYVRVLDCLLETLQLSCSWDRHPPWRCHFLVGNFMLVLWGSIRSKISFHLCCCWTLTPTSPPPDLTPCAINCIYLIWLKVVIGFHFGPLSGGTQYIKARLQMVLIWGL